LPRPYEHAHPQILIVFEQSEGFDQFPHHLGRQAIQLARSRQADGQQRPAALHIDPSLIAVSSALLGHCRISLPG